MPVSVGLFCPYNGLFCPYNGLFCPYNRYRMKLFHNSGMPVSVGHFSVYSRSPFHKYLVSFDILVFLSRTAYRGCGCSCFICSRFILKIFVFFCIPQPHGMSRLRVLMRTLCLRRGKDLIKNTLPKRTIQVHKVALQGRNSQKCST